MSPVPQKFMMHIISQNMKRPADDDLIRVPRKEITQKIRKYLTMLNLDVNEEVEVTGDRGDVIYYKDGEVKSILDTYL